MASDARQERLDNLKLVQEGDTRPEDLAPVPGTVRTSRRRKRASEMQRVSSVQEARDLVLGAISRKQDLKLVYVTRSEERKTLTVTPERVASTPQGTLVLVARDHARDQRLSYQLTQIDRLVAITRK